MTIDEAESIAIAALGWLASERELFERFCAVSGIDPSEIRTAAAEPGFLAGVLQFIAAHEPTLARFSLEAGVGAAEVLPAIAALPGGVSAYDRSI